MVLQGEIVVKLEGLGKGMGEFFGGAKLAGQGKQAESGAQGPMGMAGGLGMKALLGSEGFGGLKKSMVGMSGPIGKMGGALMKGGVVGIATGALSSIMGILSKALGSSSIFTGVAAQFWKIAGVMVDMLLMPLLPLMMKFIQWMMSSVMPEIMKLSTAIGRALQGDVGPLIGTLWSLYIKMLEAVWIKLPRILLDVIIVAWKNTMPGWMGGEKGATVKGRQEERAEKTKIREGTAEQRENMGWREKSGILTQKKMLGRLMDKLGIINNVTNDFGENIIKDAGKSGKDLVKFVDKEKNVGKVWWKKWNLGMWGNSILPNIKKDTQGYLETLSGEAGGVADTLFGWIGGINWGIFGTIGGKIKDAASAVWGTIKGFFTGENAEGEEVTPSIPSIISSLNPLNWFPTLTSFAGIIKDKVWAIATGVWSAIKGFFTGKDSEGKDVSPSITSILPKIPSLSGIIGTLVDIKDIIWQRATDIWNGIKGFFTGSGNPTPWTGPYIMDILPKVPTLSGIIGTLVDIKDIIVKRARAIWGGIKGFFTGKDADGAAVEKNITDILPKVPKLSEIIDVVFNVAETIKTKATEIWNGIKTFFTETLPGKIPGIGEFSKTVTMYSGYTFEQKGTGILGALEDVFGAAMDIAGEVKKFAGKIWNGIKTFFTETLPGKIPTWAQILTAIGEVWDATTTFASTVGTAIKNWAGKIWGSWSDKTGIAGLIPKLLETLKNIDIMGTVGDFFRITLDTGTKKQMDALRKEAGYMGRVEGGTYNSGDWEFTVGIKDVLKEMGNMVKEQAMRPITWIKTKYNDLKTFISGLTMPSLTWSDVGGILKDIINLIIGGINKAICWVIEKYNNTIGSLSLPDMLGGFSLKISNPSQYQLPRWSHQGGMVPGGPSANVPTILQGGERVIPRNSVNYDAAGGGGGTNQVFNINITSNYSPGDIIKSIVQSGATDEVAYLNTVG